MIGPTELIQKKIRAISVLRRHRAVLVALSGGVDSAVLLAIACEALDSGHVLAVTGRSAAVTSDEVDDARRISRRLSVRHEVIETHEIERSAYRANTGDRCFHCRSELFDMLSQMSLGRGIPAIAYGAIADDLGEDRPGMEAARRMGILAPLLDAGMRKKDIRTLADTYGLHVHDKPASPCLASRIPIGTEVTIERLRAVEKAEAALRRLGFRIVRVRHNGETARIELGSDELPRIIDHDVRTAVDRDVKAAGFRFVVIDPAGYRGGATSARTDDRLYLIQPARDSGQ